MDLRDALEDVRRRVDERQEQRARIDAELASLLQEEQGLNLAVKRHNLSEVDDPETSNPEPHQSAEWQGLPRTSAIEQVLAESPRPLSPAQIATALREHGRSDPAHHVSSALAHLSGRNRVTSVARGQWTLPSQAAGSDSDDAAEPDRSASSPDGVSQPFSLRHPDFPSPNGTGEREFEEAEQ